MDKKSQLHFLSRCAILMESGISLSEAITIIRTMERSAKAKEKLYRIHTDINKGIQFSKSLVTADIGLDSAYISMISYGEESGTLSLTLRQIAVSLEKKDELKKRLIGAMIYPSFIAIATVIMTIFLLLYIFPKILPLFSSMNIQLPLLTRIVQKIYEITVHFGLWIMFSLTCVTLLLYYPYHKNVRIRYHSQVLMLSFPGIGDMLKKYFVNIYCETMHTLLESGLSLSKAVEHMCNRPTFLPYGHALALCYKDIEKGITLSSCLRNFPTLFASDIPDMISIGERTGNLSKMSLHISRIYEHELEDVLKKITTLIEPALMILMGIVVGSIALSIVLPIYEITNHISTK